MGLHDGIVSAIGDTPLVRLRRVYPDVGFRLFAKLEAHNPGGSSKDRPARGIIEDGLRTGRIGPETVIVESSSGNMGVGLAQVCRFLGLRFICVVDSRTAPQNLKVIRAYGAEVECVTEPDPETGELLVARLKRVQQLLDEHDDSFWPNQYANAANARAHYESTIREVVEDLDGELDYLFCAVSTCGTIRGSAEYLRDQGLPTRVIAVDAVGSRIFGSQPQKRLVPGLGAGLVPELLDPDLVSECVHVSDADCVIGCRRLVDREAILAGGSSGGVIAAVGKMRDRIPDDANCVAILSDRGERYLDLVYSDEWVREHFGDVDELAQADAIGPDGRVAASTAA